MKTTTKSRKQKKAKPIQREAETSQAPEGYRIMKELEKPSRQCNDMVLAEKGVGKEKKWEWREWEGDGRMTVLQLGWVPNVRSFARKKGGSK